MRSSRSLLLLTLALGLALTGCPKKDDAASSSAPSASAADTASAAPSASTGAAPSAGASASASALAGTGAEDAGAPTATSATATAKSTGGAATIASGAGAGAAKSSDGAGVCGKKPLPDCPLQHWMKENTAAAMASNDLPSVATALDKVVKFAPPGYTNWSSIAKDGADAARAGKLDAVKNACRTCHDQYKNKYKSELRTRPVPGQ